MKPGGYFDHAVGYGRYLWSKIVYTSETLVYIRPGNKTSLVFFSA